MPFKKSLIGLCILVILVGCNTANLKQNIGTGVGAILGAGLGNKLCEGHSDQELCTLLGSLAGAYLGSVIGKRLDEQDRERHVKATQDVLVASQQGANSSWENKQNGTSGSVTVVGQTKKSQTASIPVFKDKVEQVPPLELIDQVYTTDKIVNVRVGPGTDYKKAPPALNPGEKFDVIGRVINSPKWLMIEKNGAGSGFVYSDLVQPMGVVSAPQKANSADVNVAMVPTETVRQCKTVQHKITYDDGKVETDTVEMCQQDDGSWSLA